MTDDGRCSDCGAVGFHQCLPAQAQREIDCLAREFWERAALEAFTAKVMALGSDYLPRQNIIDVATYADTMLDEWRKRFDPKEGM